jgi:hypothetical protein
MSEDTQIGENSGGLVRFESSVYVNAWRCCEGFIAVNGTANEAQ